MPNDAAAGNIPNTGAQPAAAAAAAPAAAAPTAAAAAPAPAPAAAAPAAAGGAPAKDGKEPQATQGTDTLLDGKSGDGAKPGDDSGAQKAGAPEKYEFKTPEGVKLDEGVVSEFSAVAKELDLPQDAAQKIVDKLAPKLAERTAAELQQAINATNEKWVAEVKADPEIGGENFEANLAVAKKALDAFGTPALRMLLNNTRLGNNPELIRTFFRIGQAISEDTPVPSETNSGATPNADKAAVLYGKSK